MENNTISRIQKRHNLNEVECVDEAHPLNKGHHHYVIRLKKNDIELKFQKGPRGLKTSTDGVLDVDLLEIVRHRLRSFQNGPYATRENAIALTHVEEALLWLNKRVEDRIEENKFGTDKI